MRDHGSAYALIFDKHITKLFIIIDFVTERILFRCDLYSRGRRPNNDFKRGNKNSSHFYNRKTILLRENGSK